MRGQPQWRPRVSCHQVGRLLQAYLDGELGDTRALLIANHLDACLRCGLEAGTYRWLKEQLAGLASGDDGRQLERLRDFAHELIDESA